MKKVLISLAVTVLTLPAWAERLLFYEQQDDGSVLSIRELSVTDTTAPFAAAGFLDVASDCSNQKPLRGGFTSPTTTGDVNLDAILLLGKQVWTLIKDNAPVVEVKTASASALPQGIDCWNQLERWKPLRVSEYEIAYTNLYGFDVARYRFRLVYAWGGSYKGQGHFIANAAVQTKDLFVLITNRLDVEVQIPQVLNVGTVEDPIASMQITVGWRLRNIAFPFIDRAQSLSFELRGDGAPVQIY